MPRKKRVCETPELHTECPDEYGAWGDWAWKMTETHNQTPCPSCGLWAVWIPREKHEESTG